MTNQTKNLLPLATVTLSLFGIILWLLLLSGWTMFGQEYRWTPPEMQETQKEKTLQNLIYALAMVETGQPYQNSSKRGLAGEIGPLQILKPYWLDSKISGRWEDCENWDYSVRVVKAYWERYAKQALKENDFEVLARIHNGGPAGAKKQATKKYWEKVKKFL